MTAAASPGHIAARDFRVGHVLSRTASLFARNFPTYFVLTAVAGTPPLLVDVLVPASPATVANPFPNVGTAALTFVLTIVVGILSQAMVLYGAFQDMRGRPVRLADCLQVGLRGFLPLVGLAICMVAAMAIYVVFIGLAAVAIVTLLQSPFWVTLAFVPLVVPLLIFYLMWFVTTPACVVERLGPFRSMGRSRELTTGQRWKMFGLVLAVLIPATIVAAVITAVMGSLGISANLRIGVFFDLARSQGSLAAQLVGLVWTAVWTAFYAVLVAVAYHDLRVAKEGVDTEQIAAVFE